jgi:hypothetical protein
LSRVLHDPFNSPHCNKYCFQRLYITYALTLISGFRRDVDKICALLGHYAASCGNCVPTFRDNVSVPSSKVKNPRRKQLLTLEDGTDTLYLNVGTQLRHDAA